MCAGRFIDAQDDFDGRLCGVTIYQWSAILAYSSHHIGDLQDVASYSQCSWILCGSTRFFFGYHALLAFLFGKSVETNCIILALITRQVQIAQIIVGDHGRSLVAVDLPARASSPLGP